MDVKDGRSTRLALRRVDEGTATDIRVMASRFRVTQAKVVEEAIWWFQCELGKSIPLPDGWTKPRDF